MAILSASVAFLVNASRMVSLILKSLQTLSLALVTAIPAMSDKVWPPLPGFAQYSRIHLSISWQTHAGLGKDVAALSRYIIIAPRYFSPVTYYDTRRGLLTHSLPELFCIFRSLPLLRNYSLYSRAFPASLSTTSAMAPPAIAVNNCGQLKSPVNVAACWGFISTSEVKAVIAP
jgi:hypothetical protein